MVTLPAISISTYSFVVIVVIIVVVIVVVIVVMYQHIYLSGRKKYITSSATIF